MTRSSSPRARSFTLGGVAESREGRVVLRETVLSVVGGGVVAAHLDLVDGHVQRHVEQATVLGHKHHLLVRGVDRAAHQVLVSKRYAPRLDIWVVLVVSALVCCNEAEAAHKHEELGAGDDLLDAGAELQLQHDGLLQLQRDGHRGCGGRADVGVVGDLAAFEDIDVLFAGATGCVLVARLRVRQSHHLVQTR